MLCRYRSDGLGNWLRSKDLTPPEDSARPTHFQFSFHRPPWFFTSAWIYLPGLLLRPSDEPPSGSVRHARPASMQGHWPLRLTSLFQRRPLGFGLRTVSERCAFSSGRRLRQVRTLSNRKKVNTVVALHTCVKSEYGFQLWTQT